MIGLYVVWNLNRRTDQKPPLSGLSLPLPEPLSRFLSRFESPEKRFDTRPSGATRDGHEKVLHREVDDNQPRNLESLRRDDRFDTRLGLDLAERQSNPLDLARRG